MLVLQTKKKGPCGEESNGHQGKLDLYQTSRDLEANRPRKESVSTVGVALWREGRQRFWEHGVRFCGVRYGEKVRGRRF